MLLNGRWLQLLPQLRGKNGRLMIWALITAKIAIFQRTPDSMTLRAMTILPVLIALAMGVCTYIIAMRSVRKTRDGE